MHAADGVARRIDGGTDGQGILKSVLISEGEPEARLRGNIVGKIIKRGVMMAMGAAEQRTSGISGCRQTDPSPGQEIESTGPLKKDVMLNTEACAHNLQGLFLMLCRTMRHLSEE